MGRFIAKTSLLCALAALCSCGGGGGGGGSGDMGKLEIKLATSGVLPDSHKIMVIDTTVRFPSGVTLNASGNIFAAGAAVASGAWKDDMITPHGYSAPDASGFASTGLTLLTTSEHDVGEFATLTADIPVGQSTPGAAEVTFLKCEAFSSGTSNEPVPTITCTATVTRR